MTATALAVVPRNRAVQYDGTNGTEIEALIDDFTIITDSGTSLAFTSGGAPWSVPSGGFIIFNEAGSVYDTLNTQGAFDARFHSCVVEADLEGIETDLETLSTQVEALSEGVDSIPAAISAIGETTFAPLVSLGSTTVTVTLVPAMPDTNFDAHVTVFGGVGVLSNVTIGTITVVDADTVTVQITNNSLSLLGGTVQVAAVPN